MPSANVSNGDSHLALTVGSRRPPNNCTWSQRCEPLEGQGIPNESRKIPRNPNPSGFQKFGLIELNKLDLSPFCSPTAHDTNITPIDAAVATILTQALFNHEECVMKR